MYYNGRGVEQDFEKAATLYKVAAAQGIPEALFNLGALYEEGDGVEQHQGEALKLYIRAAEKGHISACHDLGVIYNSGRFEPLVPSDPEEAAKWFTKAAGMDNEESQAQLGSMYLLGRGVNQSKKKAVKLFKKAARRGQDLALWHLGMAHREGYGGLKKSDKLAVKYWQQAAELGSSEGQASLGHMYLQGLGVKKDERKAHEWLAKAAEQGSEEAIVQVGGMFLKGVNGAQTDRKEALRWFNKGVELGHVHSMTQLGLLHTSREMAGFVEFDYRKAADWYRKAAEKGHAVAMYLLADLHEKGNGVAMNLDEAVKLYTEAAQAGSEPAAEALRRLGHANHAEL